MAAPDAGASFSIDLAATQQSIDDLKNVRHELQDIQRHAYRLAFVVPPAADAVSRDAATVIGRAAYGGPGSLYDSLGAGIVRLTDMIRSMEQELASYRQAEVDGAQTFDADA